MNKILSFFRKYATLELAFITILALQVIIVILHRFDLPLIALAPGESKLDFHESYDVSTVQLFTNNDFHNTAVPAAEGLPDDYGRAKGAQQVMADEFNCLSPYSDAAEGGFSELVYMVSQGHELERQFKPPSLRNVAARGPFMHAGQFATLEQVLNHYNTAPEAPTGHSELEPLHLSQKQIEQIIAFLKTLDSPVNADPKWLRAPQ